MKGSAYAQGTISYNFGDDYSAVFGFGFHGLWHVWLGDVQPSGGSEGMLFVDGSGGYNSTAVSAINSAVEDSSTLRSAINRNGAERFLETLTEFHSRYYGKYWRTVTDRSCEDFIYCASLAYGSADVLNARGIDSEVDTSLSKHFGGDTFDYAMIHGFWVAHTFYGEGTNQEYRQNLLIDKTEGYVDGDETDVNNDEGYEHTGITSPVDPINLADFTQLHILCFYTLQETKRIIEEELAGYENATETYNSIMAGKGRMYFSVPRLVEDYGLSPNLSASYYRDPFIETGMLSLYVNWMMGKLEYKKSPKDIIAVMHIMYVMNSCIGNSIDTAVKGVNKEDADIAVDFFIQQFFDLNHWQLSKVLDDPDGDHDGDGIPNWRDEDWKRDQYLKKVP